MKKVEKAIVCDVCGVKAAKIRRISRTYGKGARLLMIENVPVVTCSNCGENYMTADVLHELDRIKLHRRGLTSDRTIRVATFASA